MCGALVRGYCLSGCLRLGEWNSLVRPMFPSLAPELPTQQVSGDVVGSVTSRVRPAWLLRLRELDSRRWYVYGVCPNRGLDGAEKICTSEMLKVKLRFVGLNVIEERRDYKHACTRFVAADLQLSRSRGGIYTTHPVRACGKYLAAGYEVERYVGNNCVSLLGTSIQAQPKNADQCE